MYERPTIKIICGNWLVQTLIDLGINKNNIYVLDLDKKYDLGKYIIEIFNAEHDIPNCGYKITIKDTNYKIFHVTDVSNLDNVSAKDFDFFGIENNYQEDLIDKHIQECEDANMLYYLQRAKKTHLSDAKCNSFLIENMGSGSEYCYLHQSSYNYEEVE